MRRVEALLIRLAAVFIVLISVPSLHAESLSILVVASNELYERSLYDGCVAAQKEIPDVQCTYPNTQSDIPQALATIENFVSMQSGKMGVIVQGDNPYFSGALVDKLKEFHKDRNLAVAVWSSSTIERAAEFGEFADVVVGALANQVVEAAVSAIREQESQGEICLLSPVSKDAPWDAFSGLITNALQQKQYKFSSDCPISLEGLDKRSVPFDGVRSRDTKRIFVLPPGASNWQFDEVVAKFRNDSAPLTVLPKVDAMEGGKVAVEALYRKVRGETIESHYNTAPMIFINSSYCETCDCSQDRCKRECQRCQKQ